MTKEDKMRYSLDIIVCGDVDKPIKARELAIMWDTTPRGVREIIMNLRLQGEPICSGNAGYWYATETEQMLDTVRRIRAHALKELKVVAKMAKILRERGHKV